MMIFWSHCGYLREVDHYHITLLHTGNISPPPPDPAPPLSSLMMYETHFLRPSYHTRRRAAGALNLSGFITFVKLTIVNITNQVQTSQ